MKRASSSIRSQADRRHTSRQAILSSACKLFGERGYANTSLEDIAKACGLTITPVYHYFGNKKALFIAVTSVMEQRIVGSMGAESIDSDMGSIIAHWRAFLDLCEDPGFRRIVLIDSPNILGRERWSDSIVSKNARALIIDEQLRDPRGRLRQTLFTRIIMGAFTEAALMIAEAEDAQLVRKEAEKLIVELFSAHHV